MRSAMLRRFPTSVLNDTVAWTFYFFLSQADNKPQLTSMVFVFCYNKEKMIKIIIFNNFDNHRNQLG